MNVGTTPGLGDEEDASAVMISRNSTARVRELREIVFKSSCELLEASCELGKDSF